MSRRKYTKNAPTHSSSNIILHIRDIVGEYLSGVEVAIYKMEDKSKLFSKITEDEKVNINLPIDSSTDIEIRCRKTIPGKERYVNFSTKHTVFPPVFELKIVMEKDLNYNPV